MINAPENDGNSGPDTEPTEPTNPTGFTVTATASALPISARIIHAHPVRGVLTDDSGPSSYDTFYGYVSNDVAANPRASGVTVRIVEDSGVLTISAPFEFRPSIDSLPGVIVSPVGSGRRSRSATIRLSDVPNPDQPIHLRLAVAAVLVSVFLSATVEKQSCFMCRDDSVLPKRPWCWPSSKPVNHIEELKRWHTDINQLAVLIRRKIGVEVPVVGPSDSDALTVMFRWAGLAARVLGESIGLNVPDHMSYMLSGHVDKYRPVSIAIEDEQNALGAMFDGQD